MAQLSRIGTCATKVATSDNVLRVTYHNTVVFEWDRGADTVTLNSNGYRTVTTKTRINQAFNQFGIPYRVFQKDYAWYVERLIDGEYASPIDFYDGITLAVSQHAVIV